MVLAKIYRPAKSAMQAGQAASRRWVLEFEPQAAPSADALMGWTSTTDTDGQVRIYFPTQNEAVAFA
ncbi:MAG TPA: NADH dehydrogenase ubiquinone Fe-S protein 4, partial [Caulobacterales bacterium]|nr:NADH dehydrogenase ubiquinone Fe-S protein 4 [Caulobacterales bacterium]